MERCASALSALLLSQGLAEGTGAGSVDVNVISVFGSSVANGAFCSGNCSGHAYNPSAAPGGCYQSRLREYQSSNHKRSVFNNGHGGDTTTKLLNRFNQFLSSKAGFAFIGLSLANEGLICGPVGDPCHQEIFNHYEAGMRQLVAQIRDAGAMPILGACYPNSDYTEEEYAYIKRMNLLTVQWDLATPQVNFLGAIEDGKGRWAAGHHANGGHPNDKGSTEMYYAFVPSIFDAILAGKPTVPARADGSQFLPLKAGSAAESVVFSPKSEETLHSFTLAFDLRCDGCDGEVSKILATKPPAPTPAPTGMFTCDQCVAQGFKEDKCHCGYCGSFGGCIWSCSADASRPQCWWGSAEDLDSHVLSINTVTGGLQYMLPAGGNATPSLTVNDGNWHSVALTHYHANGSISLYVDGMLASQEMAKLDVKSFALSSRSAADFRDLLIYRSGLGDEERAFNLDNRTHVLHASLEVYAPLDATNPTENRAQSLSEIFVKGATVTV